MQTMRLDTQQLLFEESSPVRSFTSQVSVPPEFYDQGWTLLRGVDNIDSALEAASAILGSLDESRLAFCADLLPRLQLAKADRLPCREPDIQESFQALHFDMGLPLAPRDQQIGYLFAMLYFPVNGDPGRAETRIVNVDRLLRQRKFHTPAECDARLRDYAERFGDGWTKPRRHITGRLGCFARVVDAMLDQHELVSFFDLATWEWFREGSGSQDGREELAAEMAWWARHGYRLEEAETRIQLQPGDLLLFNNMSCAHGRIGTRRPEELWQVMWGVPHVGAGEISLIRSHISAALAGD